MGFHPFTMSTDRWPIIIPSKTDLWPGKGQTIFATKRIKPKVKQILLLREYNLSRIDDSCDYHNVE